MNLVQLLNQQPINYFYLALDPSLDINLPEIINFYSLSPEKLGITLKIKNSGKFLSHPKVIEYINSVAQKSGFQSAIIPFKPSAKIDFLCHQHHWLKISNPSHLNRDLEDKIKFAQLCDQHHLPTIPHLISSFNQSQFVQAQQQLGPKLVIQTHFGWAGNSTHLADNWEDISSIIPANTIVKISPYLDGYTLLNNCCLTKYGLIQSPPALQYTGLKALTINPFTTVGRQWPSTAPANIENQISTITTDFSAILASQNYSGYFGLDFFIHQNQAYLLECNPRLTASFAFYHQIELNHNLNSLLYFHLASFLNLDFSIDPNNDLKRYQNTQLTGSEITLKDSHSVTIKKYHDFTRFSSSSDNVTIPPEILNHVQ